MQSEKQTTTEITPETPPPVADKAPRRRSVRTASTPRSKRQHTVANEQERKSPVFTHWTRRQNAAGRSTGDARAAVEYFRGFAVRRLRKAGASAKLLDVVEAL